MCNRQGHDQQKHRSKRKVDSPPAQRQVPVISEKVSALARESKSAERAESRTGHQARRCVLEVKPLIRKVVGPEFLFRSISRFPDLPSNIAKPEAAGSPPDLVAIHTPNALLAAQ